MVVPKTKGSSTKLKGESGDFILLIVLERIVRKPVLLVFLVECFQNQIKPIRGGVSHIILVHLKRFNYLAKKLYKAKIEICMQKILGISWIMCVFWS